MIVSMESVESISGRVLEEISQKNILEESMYGKFFREIKSIEYQDFLLCKLPPRLRMVPTNKLPFEELKNRAFFHWERLPLERLALVCEGEGEILRLSDVFCGEFSEVSYQRRCSKCESRIVLGEFHTHWRILIPSAQDLHNASEDNFQFISIGGICDGRAVFNCFDKKPSVQWSSILKAIPLLYGKVEVIRRAFPLVERAIVFDPEHRDKSWIEICKFLGEDSLKVNRRLRRVFSKYFDILTFIELNSVTD